jgi:drug/metabolite transporter (DMT)-like permease
VVALVAGYLMLGEPITPAQLLGGAGIIGGLLLMRRARRMPLPS